MLRIYYVALELVRQCQPLIRKIARRNPDLARQFDRALCSGPLNIAEGSFSRGKNRNARYHTAMGSFGEARAALEIAVVSGCIGTIDPPIKQLFRQVIGTLVRVTRP